MRCLPSLGVCVLPPCVEDLEKRLLARGDKAVSLAKRMATVSAEMDARDEFDNQVVNANLFKALMEVLAILEERRDLAELMGGVATKRLDMEREDHGGGPGLLTVDQHAGELEMAA